MAYWIWKYGDLEIRQSFLLHSKRDEFGYIVPAFWYMEDCSHSVIFRGKIAPEREEKLEIRVRGTGYFSVDGKKYPFSSSVTVSAGEHDMEARVVNVNGLPALYVRAGESGTDGDWTCTDLLTAAERVGFSDMYRDPDGDPESFPFRYEEIFPVSVTETAGGALYDFGRETFAKLIFDDVRRPFRLFYGESPEEAQGGDDAYVSDEVDGKGEKPCRAFRYILTEGGKTPFRALREYAPAERVGSFSCSDELLNRIWNTAAHTLELNCREFYLDGIKRDRWVWSGDAYQSYFVGRYLYRGGETMRRTIVALRGNRDLKRHINTIVDYTLYWIMSVYDYYEATGDADFVVRMIPKIDDALAFCERSLDGNGFIVPHGEDWAFVDWSDIDKNGANVSEQFLYAAAMLSAAKCREIAGRDPAALRAGAEKMLRKTDEFFWDSEKGAYIDSFESGRRHVTRHGNLFPLIFRLVPEKRRDELINNVLRNGTVPPITTPYFKFYELDAEARYGDLSRVTEEIRSYWGGMIRDGATSFWEEYVPEWTREEKLSTHDMYGLKFGKSLCHAWGASPVYLIGRYYLGVRPTSPRYATFEVEPRTGGLDMIEGTVPAGKGTVKVKVDGGVVEASCDVPGGTLVAGGERYPIEPGEIVRVETAQQKSAQTR